VAKETTKLICGDICEVISYQGKLRFEAIIAFSSMPTAELPANMSIETYKDGSCNIRMQCLVSEDITDIGCEEVMDRMEVQMRSVIGNEPMVTSGSWYLGYGNDEWDHLMTAEEQSIVKEK